MYKMVAIDIDDTLLTDTLEITDGTKKALAMAIQQGVIVTLATGRMHASAKQVAASLGLNVPIISYQGALVKNLLDDRILYARYVPDAIAEEVANAALSRRLHLQWYVDDVLYTLEDNEKIKAYSRISNVPYRVEPQLSTLKEKPILKLLIFEDEAITDSLKEEWEAKFSTQAHITKSKPYFVEVTHPEATKGHALASLAKTFGIEMEQVIAIGDSWNDREMLEAAGLGVAMDNAVPALKAMADFVTRSNNEEGVKHVIEKFVLQASR